MAYVKSVWLNDSKVGNLHPDAIERLNNIETGLDGVANGGLQSVVSIESAPYNASPTATASYNAGAIQAALTASKRVFIPPSSYSFNTALTYQDGTEFFGVRNFSSLNYTGAGFAIDTPDLTTYRNVILRDFVLLNGGIRFASIDYGKLEGLRIGGATGDQIKTERTAGNIVPIRDCVIEANYQATTVGVRILSDWVSMENVVISKATSGGVIVGSATVKPLHIALTRVHGFLCRSYLLDIISVFDLHVNDLHAEIGTTTDAAVLGFIRNQATNTDVENFIYDSVVQSQPSLVNAGYLVYNDLAGTLKIRSDAFWSKTQNVVLSADFAIDATGFKTVTIPHGLAVTPPLNQVSVSIAQKTAVFDWGYNNVLVQSADATNVTVAVNITTASATVGAKADVLMRVGR